MFRSNLEVACPSNQHLHVIWGCAQCCCSHMVFKQENAGRVLTAYSVLCRQILNMICLQLYNLSMDGAKATKQLQIYFSRSNPILILLIRGTNCYSHSSFTTLELNAEQGQFNDTANLQHRLVSKVYKRIFFQVHTDPTCAAGRTGLDGFQRLLPRWLDRIT